jgi:hypothetical protein
MAPSEMAKWQQGTGRWTTKLVPNRYDLPALLGHSMICDENWTFEDEVCADELGACAIHMEWQEPFSIHHVYLDG